MQILIPFYSLYGHVYELAKAIGEGVEKAGASPKLMFVQETLSPEVLEKMGAAPAEARGANLPAPTTDDMVASAGIIFGTPTRFGGMVAQMRAFLDRTGGIWVQQALAGKVGGVFTSSSTQHGGQETTHFAFHTFMLHHGMLISGAGFSYPGLFDMNEIHGGTPYGASTVAGADGSRRPTANELGLARFQGESIARAAIKLAK